jgi:steroid 5-alpha reductase family enzyme
MGTRELNCHNKAGLNMDSFSLLLEPLRASWRPLQECVFLSGSTIAGCFYGHDALGGIFWAYALITAYCLIFAQLSGNYSKVDQIWSITPWLYGWMLYAHWSHSHPGLVHERLLLVCVLATIWGARLTYNFWRRNGYGNLITHDEDYRWPILRKRINSNVLFALFNATFIAPYQNLILLLLIMPAYQVMNAETSCNTRDYACAVAFFALLVMETVADQQHWNYHNKKYSVPASQRSLHPDQDVRDGFLQSGLFRYCRHPNYFAEQAQWICVYFFTLTHTPLSSPWELFNIYGLGAFLLVTLFQGSMSFSESITVRKYPRYKLYQAYTNQCIPSLFTSSDSDEGRKSL